jgi:hypothetical protein
MSNIVEPYITKTESTSLFDKFNNLPAKIQPIKQIPLLQIQENLKEEEKFPYLVLEEFIIENKWENKMGNSGIQEIPITKNSFVFLPTTVHKEQYEKALKDGKLKKIEYVTVKSLIDKEMGKCKTDGSLIQTMEYNPCRKVKKGQIVKGYINPITNIFTSTDGMMKLPQLSKGEYELLDKSVSSDSTPKDNKNLINIALLLGVGYVVYRLVKK